MIKKQHRRQRTIIIVNNLHTVLPRLERRRTI